MPAEWLRLFSRVSVAFRTVSGLGYSVLSTTLSTTCERMQEWSSFQKLSKAAWA